MSKLKSIDLSELEKVTGGTSGETVVLSAFLQKEGYGNFINLRTGEIYEENLKRFFESRGYTLKTSDNDLNIFEDSDGNQFGQDHIILQLVNGTF